eukprot:scaffold5033_cov106-Isochrysis_galbana.AAC.3
MGRKRKAAAADEDEKLFEVECILKKRHTDGGVLQYTSSSGRITTKACNTWEPLENLAGIEQHIAHFETRQRKEQLDFARALKKRQEEAHANMKKAPAEEPAATAAAAETETETETAQGQKDDVPGGDYSTLVGRRSALIWTRYIRDPTKPKVFVCQEMVGHGKKKIFRRKRYTLAATRRDTSVPCRPDTPPPPSHSSPIPSPSSGRLLRAGGFRAACTTTAWARVLRV